MAARPEGACGCCLVLIDGTPALSCLRQPEQMDGHDVVTLEGIPEETAAADGRGVRPRGRCSVRLLHSGHRRPRVDARRAREGRRSRRHREGARWASVPLHRIRADHRRHSDGWRSVPRRRRCTTKPRRHSFFGEEFGLRRNPAFADGQRRARQASASRSSSTARRPGADARRQAIRRRYARARHAAWRDGADGASARTHR